MTPEEAMKDGEGLLVEGRDFYLEGGFIVFTREYHLRRGFCCGSGCRYCPYEPRWGGPMAEGGRSKMEDRE